MVRRLSTSAGALLEALVADLAEPLPSDDVDEHDSVALFAATINRERELRDGFLAAVSLADLCWLSARRSDGACPQQAGRGRASDARFARRS
jgi:hypothetical protein